MPIKPFSIPYSGVAVQDLRDRLSRTRWPDSIPDSGWEYGADMGFVRDICADGANTIYCHAPCIFAVLRKRSKETPIPESANTCTS